MTTLCAHRSPGWRSSLTPVLRATLPAVPAFHSRSEAQPPGGVDTQVPVAKGDEPAASAMAACSHVAGAATARPWGPGRSTYSKPDASSAALTLRVGCAEAVPSPRPQLRRFHSQTGASHRRLGAMPHVSDQHAPAVAGVGCTDGHRLPFAVPGVGGLWAFDRRTNPSPAVSPNHRSCGAVLVGHGFRHPSSVKPLSTRPTTSASRSNVSIRPSISSSTLSGWLPGSPFASSLIRSHMTSSPRRQTWQREISICRNSEGPRL